MEPITVKYKVLDERAKVPAYATPGSAAADLCAVLDEPLTVQPMQRVLVPTGLAIELPGACCVALVYARSGLSLTHGLCLCLVILHIITKELSHFCNVGTIST